MASQTEKTAVFSEKLRAMLQEHVAEVDTVVEAAQLDGTAGMWVQFNGAEFFIRPVFQRDVQKP